MPESKTEWVDVELRYSCDTGDGGELFYAKTAIDEQGMAIHYHICSNPKDQVVYPLLAKYPRKEFAAVDISSIKL